MTFKVIMIIFQGFKTNLDTYFGYILPIEIVQTTFL